MRPAISFRLNGSNFLFLLCLPMLLLPLAGCLGEDESGWQGYVEGDFVYVSSPLGGELLERPVNKGDMVRKGQPLFSLERGFQEAALAEARDGLRRSENTLANLRKGSRPSELATIEAQLRKAKSAVDLARVEYERRKRLLGERTISEEEFDRSRTEYETSRQQVHEIQSQLTTAKLGAREDEIKAAEADVSAARARLEQARWNYDQKVQTAPRDALVFDTIREVGEYVPAGGAVVSLLPPEGRKVRFFVPEEQVGAVVPGQPVSVTWDGLQKPLDAIVNYVSPEAEYTPPVIYSSQTRAKLVFLVEARPARVEDAALFKPGQPVQVFAVQASDVGMSGAATSNVETSSVGTSDVGKSDAQTLDAHTTDTGASNALSSGLNPSGVEVSRNESFGNEMSGMTPSGVGFFGKEIHGLIVSAPEVSSPEMSGAEISGAHLFGMNESGAELRSADASAPFARSFSHPGVEARNG